MKAQQEREFLNLPFKEKLEFLYGLPARQKMDLILSAPEASRLVQSFSPETLFYTLKEIGLADAADLLGLAAPEQFKWLIDLDCWNKDRPNLERMREWLEVLFESGRTRTAEALMALDIELVTLFFRQYIRVYRLEEVQQALEVPVENLVQFDEHYAVEYIRQDTTTWLAQELLEELFESDYSYFANLMEEIYWGVEAELEEHAYQFRRARLSDRGFPDFFEAQEVFAYLNPADFERIRNSYLKCDRESLLDDEEEMSDLALVLSDGSDSLFNTALKTGFSATARHQLLSESALVANQVLAARAVDFGDLEAVRGAIQLTHDYLNVALEHLAGGDLRTAIDYLRDTHLKLLFRLGISLTIDLRTRAERILSELGLQKKEGRDVPYLDSPYREALSGFLERLPTFYSGLDGDGSVTWRTFRRMRDIHVAHRVLDQIAVMPTLLREVANVDIRSHSFRAQIAGKDIRLSQILLTSLIRSCLMEQGPTPCPFEPVELDRVRPKLFTRGFEDKPRLSEEFRERVDHLLSSKLKGDALKASAAFVGHCLNMLEQELGHLSPDTPVDPRFVRSVLFRKA